jgi:glycosyltransferase involved in cell wall biosynthesis
MLSILIPIYNFDVRKLVSDLGKEAETLGIPYEILCFDDGSKPEYLHIHQVLNQQTHVEYRELPENLGRSRIRNFLAQEAKYPYLLFMDCDSGVASSDFLSNYLALASPDQVIVGKRVYQPSPPKDAQRYFRWLYGVKREQRSAKVRNQHPFEGFCTHHFLCPKAVFEKIQFDPNLRQYGHEDTQFGLDLEKIGVRVIHTDNPLLHIDLEPIAEFLPKTLKGIENLVYLQSKGSGIKTRLSDFYEHLKKWKLIPFVIFIFRLSHKILEKNLHSKKPDLRVFDLYKLGYLAQLKADQREKKRTE